MHGIKNVGCAAPCFLTIIKTATKRKTQEAFSQALTLTLLLVSQNVSLMRGCVTSKPSSPSTSNACSFSRFSWKNCGFETVWKYGRVFCRVSLTYRHVYKIADIQDRSRVSEPGIFL